MRLYIKVIPRSYQNKIEKIGENQYKIKITAHPVDGKANEMLIDLLADHFGVAKSCVAIIGGKTAKTKIVEIQET